MIQVELLGTIKILRDGTPFRMERRAQRLLMGLLALDAGRLVSSSYLIEMLWGAESPASARATLHTRISELRSLFNRQGHGDGGVALRSVGVGYCLDIAPENVDSHRFLELVGGWRQLPTAESALDRLTRALDLWRGPVFGGLAPEATPSALEALTAARLTALEDYFMINLHLGNHGSVVDRLTEAAGINPTRERLIAQCMIALYRSGRAAEALTMYANWRGWLQDALGTDPSAEVQQVYLAIVRNDDPAPLSGLSFLESAATPVELAPAIEIASPPSPVPCTLPPPADGFTGRDVEAAELIDLTMQASQRLIAVSGPAGVGKTALTVHVAHHIADRFPDGQLFVDLHGYDEDLPSETADRVLGRLLRVLGEPGAALPAHFDERVDLYRQLLAGRRMLVILDNVASDDQIAPLLTAGEACQVIVTGRTRIGAASGAHHLGLRVLPDGQARQLLKRIAGERVDSDPHGVGEVIRHCGNLPLAIRIAGAKLATKPHWSVAHLVRLLAVDRTRLSHLTHQEMSVASRIRQSYCRVSAPAQRLLALISTLDTPVVPIWMAAALLDVDSVSAERLLEELFDASLADVCGRDPVSFPRYRLGELVRDYGREQAESNADRWDPPQARRRAYAACLNLVDAVRHSHGGTDHLDGPDAAVRRTIDKHLVDDVLADPATWFDRELSVLTSMVRMAAADGSIDAGWEIADSTSAFFRMHGYLVEWQGMLTSALEALDRTDLYRARAVMLHRLGQLHAERGDRVRARAEYDRAGELFARCADTHGSALVDVSLAGLDRSSGDLDAAMRRYRYARQRLTAVGDTGGADVLRNIGQIHLQRHEYAAARQHLSAALRTVEDIGSAYERSQVLESTGQLLLSTDEPALSLQAFRDALPTFRTFGDHSGIVACLRGAALAARAMGDIDSARALVDELSTATRDATVGDPLGELHTWNVATDLPVPLIQMPRPALVAASR